MPTLDDYQEFDGLHWETGTIRNALAYQGVKAPHTGEPFSEAMLMGISGGAVMGYFLFDYEGYDPILALLTRNTFDPFDTLLERLAIPQNLIHTADADKAERNLIETLESGRPALVWADHYSLPYTLLPDDDDGMWGVYPVLVYGYDGEVAQVADRSRAPLTISADDLRRARGRIKKFKHRIMSLDAPNPDKLAAAVQNGIWGCISLYTDIPPRGKKENFGLAALQHWAKMLTNTRNKQSWPRYFPPGSRLYAALTGAFGWIRTWGAGEGMERALYADFLDEAALLLGKPGLRAAAEHFRESSAAWCALGDLLLPDEVPLLKEARELMLRNHQLFVEHGAHADRPARVARLDAIKAEAATNFPMDEASYADLRARLAAQILAIHDIEAEAVAAMRDAMS